MASRSPRRTAVYIAVLAACWVIGLAVWLTPVSRLDNAVYDWMIRLQPPAHRTPESIVVAIDEPTLSQGGGMRNIRPILADVLRKIAAAQPLAVASDVILADPEDEVDAGLQAALEATPNLILPCDLAGEKWEDPLPRFKPLAKALGHVHVDVDRADGVSRQIPLEQTAGGQRRWALALEAFRIARGQSPILESPDDLQIGNLVIPASRRAPGRPLLIRYLPPGAVPTVSALDIDSRPGLLRGKTVFVGVTAVGAHDRPVTPYGGETPGVEVHAQAFETLARGRFLTPASGLMVLGISALFTLAAGLVFQWGAGWQAYTLAVALVVLSAAAPVIGFRADLAFPLTAPVAVTWLSLAAGASFRHFFVRRQLQRTESEKSRYQQAIHWAAHEMRTPLTAIQGSSEIMSRYSLPEEKRRQLTQMINSESKRLARMIQTFLDVERLADGQMELKREPFAMAAIVETCMQRVAPLAGPKRIAVFADTPVEGALTGDRELMEYAVYNLLTNAVKYSPAGTEIHLRADLREGELRLAVRDQGIGMDAKELRNIFKKFYRTQRAEASGEAGTGIGLSLVEQIVAHHGGRMEVSSEPGRGSCFTMILAVSGTAAPAPNAEASDRRG